MRIDWVTVLDWGFNIVGLGLAIWAMVIAGGAKRAVAKVVSRSSDQEARDKAKALMKTLQDARDAAMGRKRGASRAASVGRSVSTDLHMLELAQDALATTTLISDAAVVVDLRAAAVELEKAHTNISAGDAAERDGWADALAALQVVLPKVEDFERGLAKKELQVL